MGKTPQRKKGGQFCSAINCTNCRNKPECKGLSFFLLPFNEEERCRKWIQNMRRQDIIGATMNRVAEAHYALCANHFEANQFNVPSERKRLVYNAVPTIFDFPNPPLPATLKRKPLENQDSPISMKKICIKNEVKDETETIEGNELDRVEDHTAGDETVTKLKQQLKTSHNKLYETRKLLDRAQAQIDNDRKTIKVSSTSCGLSLEQMEIIRRLRNSGATVKQIAQAYLIFDTLDKELGSFGLACNFTTNDSQISSSTYLPSQPEPHPVSPFTHINGTTSTDTDHSINNTPLQSFHLKQENEVFAQNIDSSTSDSMDIKVTDVRTIVQSSHSDYFSSERWPYGVLKEASKCYLSSLPKENVDGLIKKYSTTCPMSQSFDKRSVYKIKGLSVDEIQTFLNGEFSQLTNDKQTIILDWFSGILCQVDWFVRDVTHYFSDLIENDTLSSVYDVEFVPKRDRFTFNAIQTSVLESNFRRKQYPTPEEKTRIANECNVKLAMSYGHELQGKDRINSFNVEGWFRNRRKFLKRKSILAEEPSPMKIPPKEDRPMEMKLSDKCVSQISKPSAPVGQTHSNHNSSEHQVSISPPSVPFRPSISIPSRSINAAFPQQKSSTIDSCDSGSKSVSTSTEN